MRKPTFWFLTGSDTNQAVLHKCNSKPRQFKKQKSFLCNFNFLSDNLRQDFMPCIDKFEDRHLVRMPKLSVSSIQSVGMWNSKSFTSQE